ncbi:MAG: sigma-54-dependent Fis family transcriptional regulator [Candidatus Omnitrophota bacterium]|jgi:DNA-binding NtrC family response regulator|nr:MAG: sigma-54-dependent Fis family transcriptional regulator [Candidatus Omnitrophota bacterium]
MKYDLGKFKIIGRSQAMQDLADCVFSAAPLWDTILLTGERGTGKELLAHAIHKSGPTKGGNLVIVDCAALNASTVESVLFGHERGAFTGAVNRHVGFLESADGGTLFLDEIGSLPIEIQGRFLRFLEEQTVARVGAVSHRRIHTRILAATNRNLRREAARGHFLPDLFDRLNVIPILTPPLRKRDGDALLLFHHFMGKGSRDRLKKDAENFLLDYAYPGNVRELRNLCRRLCVFHSEKAVDKNTILRYLSAGNDSVDLRRMNIQNPENNI